MRYELQIQNGNEWQTVSYADEIKAVLEDAVNTVSAYRLIDTDEYVFRGVNVYPTLSARLAGNEWKRIPAYDPYYA